MDNSCTNMTSGESRSNDFYGYLKHPSGLMLPKVLRDQLQQSLKENSGGLNNNRPDDSNNDTAYEAIQICRHQNQNRERYWSVTEIIDMLNATSQKIQNVQTQIINGEDYYVNNVTSISVYNTKNNYSDSTTFLDSKTDSTSTNNYPTSSNTGSNATTNSNGSLNNQHRWFSSSFTNIKPHEQNIPYPTIPRKENISSLSLFSSRPNDDTSNVTAATTSQSSIAVLESDTVATTGTTVAAVQISSVPKDAATATVSKRGRNTNAQQPQPAPARRSTKRRRKT